MSYDLTVKNQQELKFEQFFTFFYTRFPNEERIRYIFTQSYNATGLEELYKEITTNYKRWTASFLEGEDLHKWELRIKGVGFVITGVVQEILGATSEDTFVRRSLCASGAVMLGMGLYYCAKGFNFIPNKCRFKDDNRQSRLSQWQESVKKLNGMVRFAKTRPRRSASMANWFNDYYAANHTNNPLTG